MAANANLSDWNFSQKGDQEFDTDCLHNITLDDRVYDQTFTPQDERAFLLEFYKETGGPTSWKNKTGWNNNNVHHCQWFGIHCYPNNTYVKWIKMVDNGLVGTPTNLWKFRNLQGICLTRNKKLTGHLSNIVYSNMTRLRRLSVSFSEIYGEIPWNIILKLTNLEKLQICCTNKRLTGEIPQDIGVLSKLQVFSIGENNMKGRLPKSISNLTKLWFLDLEYVHLTSGDLSYFSKMTSLLSLHMTNCKLSGNLPANFGMTHSKLQEIHLNGNRLNGEWAQSLNGLKNLQHLSLSRNKWRGLLPKSLGSLENLKTLDLSHNDFSGFQEGMVFNAQLEIVYLNGNNMSCDIKNLIQALQPTKHSLRILNASNCGLRGKLTDEIWNMELIIYLDLGYNSLNGVIPVANNDLAYLIHLNLASNNFNGDLDPNPFLAPLKVLRYLGIRGNLRLSSSHAFLNYMKPDYNTIAHEVNFSCPSISLTSTGGRVDMDPSFYNYSLCFCDQGYYGYGNHCLRCMVGSWCEIEATILAAGDADVTARGDNTLEVKMTIRSGYWPCCNGFDDVQRLVKCDKKEKFDNEVCSPSGNCNCKLNVSTGAKLRTVCNSSCLCRHGNTGRFCSKCINGYYKRGDMCVRCPKFSKNFPVLQIIGFILCFLLSVVLSFRRVSDRRLSLLFKFVNFVLVVTLTVLHFTSIIAGWFFIIIFFVWILGLNSSKGKSLKSFLSIAVFFFQSLDAILSEANIWPQTIVLLKYKITNVFNFEVAQLACSFSGETHPEVTFFLLLIFPVCGIVCVWLFFLFGKAIGFGIKSSTCDRFVLILGRAIVKCSTCKRLTIEILLLMYFPITAKTFIALSPCAHRDGLSYLQGTPWLDCRGTSHDWLVTLGFISLGAFVIGVPVFIFAPLLYCNLKENGEPASEETDKWLKPLYEEFALKYRRYFPLVFLARRLLLALFLSLIPASSSYQILTITSLLIASIMITFAARPYEKYFQKFEFENMADIVVSIVLLLSFVGLASLRNASRFEDSLVWLILSLNFVIMLFCFLGKPILFAGNIFKNPQANECTAQGHRSGSTSGERALSARPRRATF